MAEKVPTQESPVEERKEEHEEHDNHEEMKGGGEREGGQEMPAEGAASIDAFMYPEL